MTPLGRLLTLDRGARRLTVRALAKEIGISHSTVSRIERGGVVDLATFRKLTDWLLRPGKDRE